MNEKDIIMRVKEAKRLRVIEEAIEKQITQREAANILGFSSETSKKGSQKGAERRSNWNNS